MRRSFPTLGAMTAAAPEILPNDEPAIHSLVITIPANQTVTDIALSLPRGEDFIAFSLFGKSTGDYELNFRLPSGRPYASARLERDNLVGTQTFPATLGIPVKYEGGSHISIELRDLSGATNTIRLCFKGIRRLAS